MGENNIKLGRGTLYICKEEGPQPLYTLDEAEVTEEKIEWPKENPIIKTAASATLTAEFHMGQEVTQAFKALVEACRQTGEALVKVIRAAVDYVAAFASSLDVAQLLEYAEVQTAINKAPARVRHLAKHGKKARTRKKNINRALREKAKKEARK